MKLAFSLMFWHYLATKDYRRFESNVILSILSIILNVWKMSKTKRCRTRRHTAFMEIVISPLMKIDTFRNGTRELRQICKVRKTSRQLKKKQKIRKNEEFLSQ